MVVFHWADNKSRRNCAHCAVQSPSADFELTTGGTFCEWLMDQLSSAEPGSVLLSITTANNTKGTPILHTQLQQDHHWLLFHLHTQPLYPCMQKNMSTSYWKQPIVPVHSKVVSVIIFSIIICLLFNKNRWPGCFFNTVWGWFLFYSAAFTWSNIQ